MLESEFEVGQAFVSIVKDILFMMAREIGNVQRGDHDAELLDAMARNLAQIVSIYRHEVEGE